VKSASLPSIAVIVPNRNDSRYLPVCLRSVLHQEVKPDELIVVDDQSTDDSVQVIRSLIQDVPFARVVENRTNLGTYGAIDEGLKRSESEYALFLSSNDFVLPGIFKRAKSCLAQAPGVGLWSAMAWLVDDQDRLLRLHPSPVVALRDAQLSPRRCIELAHVLGNWFTGTSLIYRRGTLDEAGRFNKVYMGLSDLFTALIVAGRHGAVYSPEPFCAIRRHADSYLARTLAEPERLDDILARLSEFGGRTAPALFTPLFVDRTVARFRFASVRSSDGATLAAIAGRSRGWVRGALDLADRLLPRAWRRARVTVAFLVLRPFDIVPTIWYRLLGWAWVRLRSRRPARP